MGGDFTYQEAGMWYKNLDKLIQYGNLKAAKDGLNITMFYSTPDCYLKAVKDAHPELSIKQDDFFPYASDPHAYWTGYFTSRPTVKYMEAQTNTYLQVAKQLQVFGGLKEDNMPLLNELKSAMGVMQHHDAVTGTEKQHVTRDYVRMVSQAVEDAHFITTQTLNRLIFGDDATEQWVFDRCHFNESRCKTSEETAGNMIITIYNPLAWQVVHPVDIPIVDGEYEVHDGNDNVQTVQIADIPETIINMPSRVSKAKKELTFVATLPPLGYKSYYMAKVSANKKRNVRDIKYEEIPDIEEYFEKIRKKNYLDIASDGDVEDNNVVFLTNIPDEPKKGHDYNTVNTDKRAKALLKSKKGASDKNVEEFEKLFVEKENQPKRLRQESNLYPSMSAEEMRMLSDDPLVVERYNYEEMADEAEATNKTGYVKTLKLKDKVYTLNISHWFYPGAVGNNEVYENRSSGAYIFRPNAVSPTELSLKKKDEIKGPVYTETRMYTNNNAGYTYRHYNDERIGYCEIGFVVGPIDITDDVGKEYIIRYDTNIISNGEFYTDSNGRQMLKRKLNKRPQWNVSIEEPVAGNYYPVVAAASLNDGMAYLNVLPDRSVGAASLQEGSIEIMVHRRLLHDDAFGVGEALNETENSEGLVVEGTHRVLLTQTPITFKEVLENRLKPQVFVSDTNGMSYDRWKSFNNENSWLKSQLPDGVHLLTLEPFGGYHNLLIRLENYLDRSESSSRVVDLAQLFKFSTFNSVGEWLLGANAGVSERTNWAWKTVEEFTHNFNNDYGSSIPTMKARDRQKTPDDHYKINLDAKEIRTFVVTF